MVMLGCRCRGWQAPLCSASPAHGSLTGYGVSMAATLSTKGRARVLSIVRQLYRHASRVEAEEGRQQWTNAIAAIARSNAEHATTRRDLREAAAAASDVLACFDAVRDQNRLLNLYHGGDVDARDYRTRAAARVGLQVPDAAPLQPRDLASKYDTTGRAPKAEGVESMKQELYGSRKPRQRKTTDDMDEMRP